MRLAWARLYIQCKRLGEDTCEYTCEFFLRVDVSWCIDVKNCLVRCYHTFQGAQCGPSRPENIQSGDLTSSVAHVHGSTSVRGCIGGATENQCQYSNASKVARISTAQKVCERTATSTRSPSGCTDSESAKEANGQTESANVKGGTSKVQVQSRNGASEGFGVGGPDEENTVRDGDSACVARQNWVREHSTAIGFLRKTLFGLRVDVTKGAFFFVGCAL